ncbi:MAG TPA: hypothetical protein VM686_04050 [Polyangiaceae bacterium]|nr:hypothetical protein [Polyangiaceae bacterium]
MLRTGTMMAALVTSAMLMACGGDDKQAQNPQQQQCPQGQYFDGQFCQNMQGQQQQQQPPPAQTTAAPPPTSPIPVATATTGAPAQAADPASAAAATALLGPLAQQHAMPGAKPLGSAVAGNFQQGQSLETTVQMSPGKCYTVVGVALPPMTDLDIQLVPTLAMPGLPAAILAADNTQGAQAIVAGKPNCYKWALPMGAPVKMIVTAKTGSGMAAAQVYEK